MLGVAEGIIWLGQLGGQGMIFNKLISPALIQRLFQESVQYVLKDLEYQFYINILSSPHNNSVKKVH